MSGSNNPQSTASLKLTESLRQLLGKYFYADDADYEPGLNAILQAFATAIEGLELPHKVEVPRVGMEKELRSMHNATIDAYQAVIEEFRKELQA